MIECPNCHHMESLGAIFCNECGTQLSGEKTEATHLLQTNLTAQLEEILKESILPTPPSSHDSEVSLFIMDSGQMVPLVGHSEFTLGRNAEGQPVIPDIDLTPFRGYEQGVSRLHTSINVEEDIVSATDLGSANGTRINGKKIPAYKSQTLHHGDIITLGKLKIQVLIHR